MIQPHPGTTLRRAPRANPGQNPQPGAPASTPAGETSETGPLYTARFFTVFAAVMLFMTAVALQFHFGQFVEYLGHDVSMLGWLMSAGTIGALVIRLQIGRWIDRFGCRPTWVFGAIIVAASTGAMQFTHSLWVVVLLRVISTMATASVQTTSTVFAAMIAPPPRRAESLGIMGLAGFMGMMVGPSLGDWFFSGDVANARPYHIFFSAIAVCSVLSAVVISRVSMHTGPAHQPPPSAAPRATGLGGQFRIIIRHWPGTVLLIGVVFATASCLQTSFLERLAERRGFDDIKLFFLAYCSCAIVTRLVFRRVPERFGRRATILGGLAVFLTGLLAMIGVREEWHLALPGALLGTGHAFVFPSMIDLAATRLPAEHRGTGTALILGSGDVGMLIGFASLGQLIDHFGFDAAIGVLIAVIALATALFAWTSRPARTAATA